MTTTVVSTNAISTDTVSYTLAIDIGIHNLGYAIGTVSKDDSSIYTFGIFDIDSRIQRKSNVVLERVRLVSLFLKRIFESLRITTVVIERQTHVNTMAMELMYCVASCCYQYCHDIVVFDPKLKFTTISIPYETRNKQHKKLSVNIIREYLRRYSGDLLDRFERYDKKDDISDSVFMLLIHTNRDNPSSLKKIRDCYEATPMTTPMISKHTL